MKTNRRSAFRETCIAIGLAAYYTIIISVAMVTFAFRLAFSALWSLLTKLIK